MESATICPMPDCVVSGCFHSYSSHVRGFGCRVPNCECTSYSQTRESMPSDRAARADAPIEKPMLTFGDLCTNPDCLHGHSLHNKMDGRCRAEGCTCVFFQKSMDDCSLFDRLIVQHRQIMAIPGMTFRGVQGYALIYSLQEAKAPHVHVYDSDEGIISPSQVDGAHNGLRCSCGVIRYYSTLIIPSSIADDAWDWTDQGQLDLLKINHRKGVIGTQAYNAEYTRIANNKYNRSKGIYA